MSPTKEADGKFRPFTETVAVEIKGCLPGGCKSYALPHPTTLQNLFASTPVSSSTNVQFSEEAQPVENVPLSEDRAPSASLDI